MKLKTLAVVLGIFIIIIAAINYKSIGRKIYYIKYKDYIVEYSDKYGLDPYFVSAVIRTESNFNANARSNKDAFGLMQITGDTAEWAAEKMNIKNFDDDMLYDPEFNIRMGCWYLNNLKTEFNGNLDLVLAAYNGGRGNVQKWLKNQNHSKDGQNLDYIPYKETDKYVKKVRVNYKIFKYLYDQEK